MDYINSNKDYIENLFEQYLKDPMSLSPEWRMFFHGIELAKGAQPPALEGAQPQAAQAAGAESLKETAVFQLISAYREDGHLQARLDPLNLTPPPAASPLALENFNLSSKDLDTPFQVSAVLGCPAGEPLKNIIARLSKAYCGSISLQAGGCRPEVREWFFKEFEQKHTHFILSEEQKLNILTDLTKAEALERFLHARFTGAKRFSIEGGDVLLPMLSYLAEQGQMRELIIGMSHRGRLNVLCNFLNQPPEIILMEFAGGRAIGRFDFEGDVKYHLGYSTVKKFANGRTCNLLLAYNPSHLESVNAVVCGAVRARQRFYKDQNTRKQVMAVLIHGDAAFCGQGAVGETLQLSKLPGYTTGGALHIILNNQVGFTTNPSEARSSFHAGDPAKAIDAPILLVNADDVYASMRAVDTAMRFRREFGEDVFIELIGYRRWGHNEADEPSFTQPLMAAKIKTHPRVRSLYTQTLKTENLSPPAQDLYDSHFKKLQDILDKVKAQELSAQSLSQKSLKGSLWPQAGKVQEDSFFKPVDTCPLDADFNKVLKCLTAKPEGFHLHPKIEKLILNRRKMIQEDRLDWALSELLAYGSLCLENHPVRLSGQDSIRGTFSHRHAMYFDTQTGKPYSPLAQLNPERGEFCVYNSSLSEMAVLGFEYGNACIDHSFLVLWEAQFGDFSNGAQIIIDQFIASGEEKWMQSCGLVLLLPHGYEGQGPEHSSARIERYLQLCAQGSMQVCYPTTPANFFHLLRRQVKRSFRKPLVVMTPKSLLRHSEVRSAKKDFLRCDGFQEVLPDPLFKKEQNIQVLILCSGKVYFDLHQARQEQPALWQKAALVRVEQWYPFPALALTPWLNGCSALRKVLWVQEEPVNMGALFYMIPRLKKLLHSLGRERLRLAHVSRAEKASPAAGSFQTHTQEVKHLMKSVLLELQN